MERPDLPGEDRNVEGLQRTVRADGALWIVGA